ncbi:MAG: 50S ribosomal protein L29 [Pseudomonadota bacterium]
MMTLEEMRQQTPAQLKEAVGVASQNLFKLNIRKADGQNVKPHQFAEFRRTVARLLTVLRQHEGAK